MLGQSFGSTSILLGSLCLVELKHSSSGFLQIQAYQIPDGFDHPGWPSQQMPIALVNAATLLSAPSDHHVEFELRQKSPRSSWCLESLFTLLSTGGKLTPQFGPQVRIIICHISGHHLIPARGRKDLKVPDPKAWLCQTSQVHYGFFSLYCKKNGRQDARFDGPSVQSSMKTECSYEKSAISPESLLRWHGTSQRPSSVQLSNMNVSSMRCRSLSQRYIFIRTK